MAEEDIKIAREALEPFTKSGKFKISEISYSDSFGDINITIQTPMRGVCILLGRDRGYISADIQIPGGEHFPISYLYENLGLKRIPIDMDLGEGLSKNMEHIEKNWKIISESLQNVRLQDTMRKVNNLKEEYFQKRFGKYIS